jgi:hypothetical protein
MGFQIGCSKNSFWRVEFEFYSFIEIEFRKFKKKFFDKKNFRILDQGKSVFHKIVTI